jgi:hypothetical protein
MSGRVGLTGTQFSSELGMPSERLGQRVMVVRWVCLFVAKATPNGLNQIVKISLERNLFAPHGVLAMQPRRWVHIIGQLEKSLGDRPQRLRKVSGRDRARQVPECVQRLRIGDGRDRTGVVSGHRVTSSRLKT